jgi:hypothetical protein
MVAVALAKYPNSVFKGILWMQGEYDATAGWTQTQYANALDAMVAGFRTDFGNMPIIVGGMAPGWVAADATRQPVQNALIATPNRLSNSGYANPSSPTDISLDIASTVHYSATDQRIFGGRFWTAYSSLGTFRMGTDLINPSGNIQVFRDGTYRYNSATSSMASANLIVTPSGGFGAGDYSNWLNISNITWGTSKIWTASSSEATTTIFTVGDLTPSSVYRVTVDGATTTAIASTTCSNGYCISGADGKLVLTYTGGYTTHTFTITPDTTPLFVSMTVPSSGATVASSSVSLAATSTDDIGVVGVQFMLDDITNIGSLITSTSSPNTYSTTWDSTGITSYSSHTIYAVAHDAAGNYATSTVSIYVDNVAPTLISAVYNSDTQITVTLSKLASSTTIIKSNDGGFIVTRTGSGTTYPVTSIVPGSGNSIILTTASMTAAGATGVIVTYSHGGNGTVADTLGNLLATDNTGQTIPPWNTVNPIITNVTSNVANGAYKAGAAIDIDFTFSKTIDSVSGLTVNLNSEGSCSTGAISDSTTASCTYTVGASDNANPLHISSITGAATSTDGNPMTRFTPVLNLAVNKTIVIDTTAPTVSLTAPSNNATVSGSSVTLTTSNSDAGSGIASIQFKLDGTNIGSSGTTNPYTITWDSTSATNASHTLQAVAEDTAGNYATSSINIIIDNTIHTYSIGGSVSGLTGTVVLQNNSGDNLTITSNSSFTFNTNIASGSTYSVSVLTQPSSQTCSVSNGSGTVSGDVTSVSVNCTTNSVAPTPSPLAKQTTSYSTSGGSVSASTLAQILAPSPATTAYLNSLNNQVQGCPTGFTCTSKPITNSQSVFTGNLQLGMTSSNVKQLQIFLNSQGFTVAKTGAGSSGHETTYFGPATKAALMRFQLAYKKEILTPLGLTDPTGFFGEMTIREVNLLGLMVI